MLCCWGKTWPAMDHELDAHSEKPQHTPLQISAPLPFPLPHFHHFGQSINSELILTVSHSHGMNGLRLSKPAA